MYTHTWDLIQAIYGAVIYRCRKCNMRYTGVSPDSVGITCRVPG